MCRKTNANISRTSTKSRTSPKSQYQARLGIVRYLKPRKDALMDTIKRSEITPVEIGPKRTRYLAYTDNLMVAAIDFEDGPTSEPDPPHAHPHEQITYVESGEVLFFLGNESTQLGPGDMFTVPPNQPHSIQLLTKHVRLIDSFTPVREEFI